MIKVIKWYENVYTQVDEVKINSIVRLSKVLDELSEKYPEDKVYFDGINIIIDQN